MKFFAQKKLLNLPNEISKIINQIEDLKFENGCLLLEGHLLKKLSNISN
jgi:hypothetical protein